MPTEPRAPLPQDEFAQFKTDLYDPEKDIRAEAERRWRSWIPTKTDRKRPQLRTMIKRVRDEWKREKKI